MTTHSRNFTAEGPLFQSMPIELRKHYSNIQKSIERLALMESVTDKRVSLFWNPAHLKALKDVRTVIERSTAFIEEVELIARRSMGKSMKHPSESEIQRRICDKFRIAFRNGRWVKMYMKHELDNSEVLGVAELKDLKVLFEKQTLNILKLEKERNELAIALALHQLGGRKQSKSP